MKKIFASLLIAVCAAAFADTQTSPVIVSPTVIGGTLSGVTYTGTNISGNAATATLATTATTAINLAGGAAGQAVIQAASGVSSFLNYSATATPSNLVQLDAAGNMHANNTVANLTSTATSATTLTLTNASSQIQRLTGTSTQLVVLPDATTMSVTTIFYVDNESTSAATVQNKSGTQLAIIGAGNYAEFQLVTNGTAAGTWNVVFSLPSVATGILADAGGVLGFTQSPTLAGINGVTLDSTTNAPVSRASTDTLTNKTMTAPVVNGYTECADTPTITAGAVTITNAACTFHKLSMVANTTVTLPTPVAGQSYSILACANGAWTPTFTMAAGTLAWPAATAPTATATTGKCDLYNFASHGTTYLFGQDGGRNFTAN